MCKKKHTPIEITLYIVTTLGLIIGIFGKLSGNRKAWWGFIAVFVVFVVVNLFIYLRRIYKNGVQSQRPASGFWPITITCVLVLICNPMVDLAKQDWVAIVDCTHWSAPTKVADYTKMASIDVQNWCSMYTINLQTKNSKGVEKPKLKVPNAHYIEVWKDNSVVDSHTNKETVILPPLCDGERIEIKAWATCKANRQNAEQVLITYMGMRKAHIDVKNPKWIK